MELLQSINLYLAQSRMSASRFGREALGDAGFVTELRNGRQPRAKTTARVFAYLARQTAR